jgi:hypothetical protein
MGGIEMKTSSVRRATSASRSADSYALTNVATIASSAGEFEAGGGSRSPAVGRMRCRLARRQDLKGGHEGQGDGLGLLVAGLWAERHIDRTLDRRFEVQIELSAEYDGPTLSFSSYPLNEQ